MDFLSVRQVAEKWGISPRRVQKLCGQNRVVGAIKIGYSWIIPANSPKPSDARIKSGKYTKRKMYSEEK